MKPEYPSEIEIQNAIQTVCEKGLKKPEGLFSFLRLMYGKFGIRTLFYGEYSIMALTLALFLCAFLPLLFAPQKAVFWQEKSPALVFAASPVLYMLLFGLSLLQERFSSVLELKMTCRYTVNHLLAARLLAFSLFGIALNALFLLFLNLRYGITFLQLFALSFSSLFLFSALLLFLLLRYGSVKAWVSMLCIWMLCTLIPTIFFPIAFRAFLTELPLLLLLAVGLFACLLSVKLMHSVANTRRNHLYARYS